MRERPVLDREFSFLVSLVHQIDTLRSAQIEDSDPPELLSTLIRILNNYRENEPLDLHIEPEIVEAIWPTVETWAVADPIPTGLRIGWSGQKPMP